MSQSRILGITDLNKGEDPRAQFLKSAAGDNGKTEGNPLLRTFNMANMDPNLKADYKSNKSDFESKLESINKEQDKYERIKEKKFRKTYQAYLKEEEAKEGI